MTYLRVQVQCFRCYNSVEKTATREIKAINNQPRYECFSCFTKNKNSARLDPAHQKIKRHLYCQKCNYKFHSAHFSCPYCNKIEFVMEGNISVRDLL